MKSNELFSKAMKQGSQSSAQEDCGIPLSYGRRRGRHVFGGISSLLILALLLGGFLVLRAVGWQHPSPAAGKMIAKKGSRP